VENQHRKISGYGELSQEEIDLMNEIKAKGQELQDLIYKCRGVDVAVGKTDDREHNEVLDEASRWRAIAKTDLQTGLMALTRSVAKPAFF
jgi:hypothetical protein